MNKGWVFIDKPKGMTSMRVTSSLKRILGLKSAGHAGTLDPLASGLLPVALETTTCLIPYLLEKPKTYVFDVTWGSITDTDDSMGKIIQFCERYPSVDEINAILLQFQGEILQVPPQYCAAKIQGVPAYKKARQNEQVHLGPKPITIYDLRVLEHVLPITRFEVRCSTGTYVRSLARDFGYALSTLGHISFLRRTSIGGFDVKDACTLDFFEKNRHKEREASIFSPQCVLDDIPVYSVSYEECLALWNGQSLPYLDLGPVVSCMYKDKLIALAKVCDQRLHPIRCFINNITP